MVVVFEVDMESWTTFRLVLFLLLQLSRSIQPSPLDTPIPPATEYQLLFCATNYSDVNVASDTMCKLFCFVGINTTGSIGTDGISELHASSIAREQFV